MEWLPVLLSLIWLLARTVVKISVICLLEECCSLIKLTDSLFLQNVDLSDFQLGYVFPKRSFLPISHEAFMLKLCNDIRTLIYQCNAPVRSLNQLLLIVLILLYVVIHILLTGEGGTMLVQLF